MHNCISQPNLCVLFSYKDVTIVVWYIKVQAKVIYHNPTSCLMFSHKEIYQWWQSVKVAAVKPPEKGSQPQFIIIIWIYIACAIYVQYFTTKSSNCVVILCCSLAISPGLVYGTLSPVWWPNSGYVTLTNFFSTFTLHTRLPPLIYLDIKHMSCWLHMDEQLLVH